MRYVPMVACMFMDGTMTEVREGLGTNGAKNKWKWKVDCLMM